MPIAYALQKTVVAVSAASPEFAAIDLALLFSAGGAAVTEAGRLQLLAGLGPKHLAAELKRRGMKAGGTLDERAARLLKTFVASPL